MFVSSNLLTQFVRIIAVINRHPLQLIIVHLYTLAHIAHTHALRARRPVHMCEYVCVSVCVYKCV